MNNREIKFRVWDKIRKRFEPHGSYQDEFISIALGFYSDVCISSDSLVLQQFTGKLDVNNRPIYEGDILRWAGAGETGYNYVCEYSLEECAYVLRYNRGKDYVYLNDFDMHIIANICENPSILT